MLMSKLEQQITSVSETQKHRGEFAFERFALNLLSEVTSTLLEAQ